MYIYVYYCGRGRGAQTIQIEFRPFFSRRVYTVYYMQYVDTIVPMQTHIIIKTGGMLFWVYIWFHMPHIHKHQIERTNTLDVHTCLTYTS